MENNTIVKDSNSSSIYVNDFVYASSLPRRDADTSLYELATTNMHLYICVWDDEDNNVPALCLEEVNRIMQLDPEYDMFGISYDTTSWKLDSSGWDEYSETEDKYCIIHLVVTLVATKNRVIDYLAWRNNWEYDVEFPTSTLELEPALTPEMWHSEIQKGTVPFWFTV